MGIAETRWDGFVLVKVHVGDRPTWERLDMCLVVFSAHERKC